MECVNVSKTLFWLSAAVGVAAILFMIWDTNRKSNAFHVVDLVLEGSPPKASVSKLILVIFAALSVWAVIVAVLDGKVDQGVSTLLLGVLGIFVVGRTAQTVTATYYAARKPEPDDDEDRPPARPRKDSVLK